MHSFQELPQKVGSEVYFDREKYICGGYLFIYRSHTVKIDLSESYIQDNLKVITCSFYDCPAATLNSVCGVSSQGCSPQGFKM